MADADPTALRRTQRVAFTTGAASAGAGAGADVPAADAMSVRMEPAVNASPRSSQSASSGASGISDSPRSGSGTARSSDGARNSNEQLARRDPSSSPDSARSSSSSSSRSGGRRRSHGKRVVRSSPSDGFDGQFAVDVRGVTHSYGKKGKLILNKLDLSIEQGTIYGLLGPSGCGKTTLIKVLLSNLTPREGSVVIFGEVPGSGPRSEVPGHDVGYMPQEIALYAEFTVYQNLRFYALMHGMSNDEFEDRAKYLCKLLDLKDPKSRNAGKLSGGQQRRTSLACGLLHSPKLLILDEPTVGVDPTLRTKIWKYLMRISKEEGTTVLLTTHYIEEARRAHKVGLMRDGKMLAQGTPNEIMKSTSSKTLEAAFLKICKSDEKQVHDKDPKKNDDTDSSSDDDDEEGDDDGGASSSKSLANDISEADAANEGGTGDGGRDDAAGSSALPAASNDDNDDDARNSRSGGVPKASFSDISKDDLHEHLLAGETSPVVSAAPKPSAKAKNKKQGSERHLQSPVENGHGYAPAPSSDGSSTRKPTGSGSTRAPELTGCAKVMSALALPRWNQLWGLCWKNLMRMVKGVAAMIFQFIIPSIQVILFCVAIGKDPQHIHFGIVDHDFDHGPLFGGVLPLAGVEGLRGDKDVYRMMANAQGMLPHPTPGGDGAGLNLLTTAAAAANDLILPTQKPSAARSSRSMTGSIRRLLSSLNPAALFGSSDPLPDLSSDFLSAAFIGNMRDHFIVEFYDSEAEAYDAVSTNEVWGFVTIPTNYTINTLLRLNQSMIAPLVPLPPDVLANSTLRYTLDMSNEQMTIYLIKSLFAAYTDMISRYAPDAGKTSPIQMDTPVYGDADASFTDFVAPGIIITIAFSGSIGLTAITFVLDKKTGNLDRIWSTGCRASEIMLAQVLTQLLIFVVQIGLLLIFGLLVFHLPLKGSVVLLFGICILLGVTGMMFGLVIASKVDEERDAMQAALGSFFPALLLSGVMWPVESIPMPLYWLAQSLPTTWAAEAGRSIMSRGWGLAHRQVWLGLVVPFAWSFVFFLWAARSLRPKQ